MRVVVCLKHVPDPREPSRFDPEGHTLARDSAEGMLNPQDDHALEAVLRWRDAGLELDCWALTMGPPSARDTLKRALAKGADQAVWLLDSGLAASDLLATSRALAGAVRRIGEVDLVLMGASSLDAGCGAMGAMVAERLGWPHLAEAEQLELTGDNQVIVVRHSPRTRERLRGSLPAVVSVSQLEGPPRLPSFTGIMATGKREPMIWDLADLALASEQVGRQGARTRVLDVSPPEVREIRQRAGSPAELCREILESLDAAGRFGRRP